MALKNFFEFFSHDTNPKHLEQILKRQYMINFNTPAVLSLNDNSSVHDIYDIALGICSCALDRITDFTQLKRKDRRTVCNTFTDQNFLQTGKKHIGDTHVLEYLVIDSLFHVRKRMIRSGCKDNFHHSLLSFFTHIEIVCSEYEKAGSDLCLAKNDVNLSLSMDKIFKPSIYGQLWGVQSQKENTSYKVPRFLDRFLFLLLESIKINPYAGKQQRLFDASTEKSNEENLKTFFRFLHTFFVKRDFYQKLQKLYQDDEENNCEERCIAFYLAYRLFDLDTIFYLVSKLTQLTKHTLDRDETILPKLIPIFFVPNIFGKRTYCDLIFEVLTSQESVNTKLSSLSQPTNELATIGASTNDTDPVEKANHNLKNCNRYLMFLSTMYFPILTACFYVLLYKTYSCSAKVRIKLVEFLEQSDIEQLLHEKINFCHEKMLLSKLQYEITCLKAQLKSEVEECLKAELEKTSQEELEEFKTKLKREMKIKLRELQLKSEESELESEKTLEEKLKEKFKELHSLKHQNQDYKNKTGEEKYRNFDDMERKRFAEIYKQIQNSLCLPDGQSKWKNIMSLDYLSSFVYQQETLKLISKYKLNFDGPVLVEYVNPFDEFKK